MEMLKKKIKFSKYCTLFSKNKPFFVCLLDNHKNYDSLRKELVLNKFKVKFAQNGLLRNLPCFFKIKNYLTGQLFCVLKDKLDLTDYLLFQSLLFVNSHVILFYLDNKFYANEKLQFLNNFFKSKISKLPHLSYFYFLVKLGFILKLEKLRKTN